METIIEIREKSIFKDEPIFLLVETSFFNFFIDFLRLKQLFRIVKRYFSIYLVLLVQTDFLPSGNTIFWVRAILLLVESILDLGGKERAYCYQWTTDFQVSGNHFFSIFRRLLPVIFFLSIRNVFLNEILHSGQWKQIFWLMQTDFFCYEFFSLGETITEISGSQFLKKDHFSLM